MSECILFLLDAPRVKTCNAASAFMERWEDRAASAPNKSIASFLQDLRETVPGLASCLPS